MKQEHVKLADELSQLIGSSLSLVPNQEDADQILNLVGDKLKEIANTPKPDNPVKDISENVLDVLEAIHNVLPDTEDPKKRRAKRRFIASVNVLRNFMRMFGLAD